jgi:hypothetical protein
MNRRSLVWLAVDHPRQALALFVNVVVHVVPAAVLVVPVVLVALVAPAAAAADFGAA